MPSIYYCTDNFIDLKEDVIKDYELLVEAKIIFKDKLKLINHLNEIWDSPSVWWNNPKTKEQINNFLILNTIGLLIMLLKDYLIVLKI